MGIAIRGDGGVRSALLGVQDVLGRKEPLLKVLGLRVLREIDETFKAQGKPPWQPLKPSTIAAKRQGRGKGGPQALSGLRNSFDLRVTPNQAVVFSDRPEAVFHEFGTKGPYEIKPKAAKALALPFLPGRDAGKGSAGSGKAGRLSLAGLARSTRINARGTVQVAAGATGRFAKRVGKAAVPFTNVAFYKKVIHPGLPARPMLPTIQRASEILTEEARKFLEHLTRRRA